MQRHLLRKVQLLMYHRNTYSFVEIVHMLGHSLVQRYLVYGENLMLVLVNCKILAGHLSNLIDLQPQQKYNIRNLGGWEYF
ncbi:MAG: hypothetical protein A2297_00330 [Elusimicrobia bacterium RIFOXYB2_FULL_48_7]|nr:MAG: hypothetical protein A2297_00330 [Elusimicrobia bacterium RIFOXYB2_FULL_48_7]